MITGVSIADCFRMELAFWQSAFHREDVQDDTQRRILSSGSLHTAMHCAPENWVDASDFLPERWLVEPGHKLYPVRGAWRAFEWGPRNCIGQSLAMTELRIMLAMIVREFNFKPPYEEWDRLHHRKVAQAWRGEEAYQIEEAAAHPADNYPCRITISR